MKFSIIVPIYKVEDYLRKCIDSILVQSFMDFELILIDDGSPDSSGKICDEYAFSDSRVVVIHKKNGGSSSARNYGIRVAQGEYLMFVDSDDYWDSEKALQMINDQLSNSLTEVLIFGCKDYYVDKNIIQESRKGYIRDRVFSRTKEEALLWLFENNLFPGSAWITVAKKSLVIQNNIFFIEGIKAEDIDWLINLFDNSNTIDVLDETFYVYLKNRPGSITSTGDIKSLRDILFTITHWKTKFANRDDKASYLFRGFLAYHYTIALLIYSRLDLDSKKYVYKDLLICSDILNYSSSFKSKIIRYMIFCIGINISSKLISFIYNIR
ncbi:MAG: glycosyltransferase [Bacteroidales bacterium]